MTRAPLACPVTTPICQGTMRSMADNLHSTLVAWFKVILPLAALAILSTLFLVSRTINPDDAIPFADVDVADRLRQPRMTLPTWAGVTDDGAAVTISADEARPGTGADATPSAAQIVANIDMVDGSTAELTATEGRIDQQLQVLHMWSGVNLVTSSGYRIQTEAMDTALDRTRMESAGAVTATGPLGRLDAGRMTLVRNAEDGDHLLHFAGGVKLIYDPVK